MLSHVIKCLYLAVLLLVGCDKADQQHSVHKEEFLAFGTLVNIVIYGESEQKTHAAVKLAMEDFKQMHQAWNPWGQGMLGSINQAFAAEKSIEIDASISELLLRSRLFNKTSHGFFDPAIGSLIKLWGFEESELSVSTPPSSAKLTQYLARPPRLSDVEESDLTIRSINPAVILDFGGVAKGFGVAQVADHLKNAGFKNFIVNAGGDLQVVGSKGEKPWVIGIRHPRDNGILASIKIVGEDSVFTSGDYERYFMAGGKRYHHILNPKTARPARDFQSVTIVHPDAALADAAATALFVAGKDNWVSIAKSMGVQQVMLVDSFGDVYITPQLQQRIRFNDDARWVKKIVSLQ